MILLHFAKFAGAKKFGGKKFGGLIPQAIRLILLLDRFNCIPKKPSDFSCEACIVYKYTHKKPKPSQTRAEEQGEYIHSNFRGPFPTPSYGNALYYIRFVDDATRYASVQILKFKPEAAEATIEFITELKTQHDGKHKSFRPDNGGEYVNATLSKFFKENGINRHPTPPYSPESNGVAERLNRSRRRNTSHALTVKRQKTLG
ncbi:hypothetical protein K3495_g1988 [Podosphaera aphanis]|nr:hypothetical protein K3495_g1988 [Podosphaera aphanis]